MTHLTQPAPRAARPVPSPHARPGRTGRTRRTRPAAAACALLLAAVVALAGCGGSGGSGASSADKAAAPQARGRGSGSDGARDGSGTVKNGATGAPGDRSAGATKNPVLAPSYLVRTATLTVRTPHVAAALTSARDL